MSTDDTERRLLTRWRAGDRDAGDALLRRYAPVLYRFFSRRVSHNVEELVQRTLLACAQGIERYEGRASFKSYLIGIAQNQFLMNIRSEAKERHRSTLPTPEPPSQTPSQLLAVKQEHRQLLETLMHVNEEYRGVLKLFYWQGLSVEEISNQLEIPVGTVKSRLARGRESVRQGLLARADDHSAS